MVIQSIGNNAMNDEIKTPAPIVQRIASALLDTGIAESEIRKEIMRVTGASKQNMTHWFNGTTKSPSIADIIEIAREHRLDLVWLILGEKQEEYWAKNNASKNTHTSSPVNIGHAENVHVHEAAPR